MDDPKRASVTFQITKNIGNYESIKVGATREMTILKPEDEETMWSEVVEDVARRTNELIEGFTDQKVN